MRIHRFIGLFDFSGKVVHITDREIVHQIRSVLKLKAGELVILSDGHMKEINGRIKDVGMRSVEVDIIRKHDNENEAGLHVVLYCAVLKKENFDLVVQKATEVGVYEIIPVVSNRTVKLNVNGERLQKIAREAAEQSGRGIVPKIHEPMDFKQALEHARPNNANYFFELGAPLFDKGILRMKDMHRVGLFIGTEGGWDPSEVEAAKLNYFHMASLGPLTFRAETAAIIGSYLIAATYL